MNIALIQMSCGIDRRESIQKAVELVNEAADKGANMVCLQELYASRYFPQNVDVKHYDLASPLPDESVKTMQRIASEKKVGYNMKSGGNFINHISSKSGTYYE